MNCTDGYSVPQGQGLQAHLRLVKHLQGQREGNLREASARQPAVSWEESVGDQVHYNWAKK